MEQVSGCRGAKRNLVMVEAWSSKSSGRATDSVGGDCGVQAVSVSVGCIESAFCVGWWRATGCLIAFTIWVCEL